MYAARLKCNTAQPAYIYYPRTAMQWKMCFVNARIHELVALDHKSYADSHVCQKLPAYT